MTTYKPVPITPEGNSTEPVQYVGTYVLRWPQSAGPPQIGFVETAEYPSVTPVRILLEAMGWISECPYCQEGWRSTYHINGDCELYNRYLDVKDYVKCIEEYTS